MFDDSSYCMLPWTSIRINPDGNFKLCAFSGVKHRGRGTKSESEYYGELNGMSYTDDGRIMNILTHSFEEALNSKLHKELRLAQANGERHDNCEFCWRVEDGLTSQGRQPESIRLVRKMLLDPLTNAVPKEVAAGLINDKGEIFNNSPISLDLNISNVCNMKCVMCSSMYSTLWYEDEMLLTGKSSFTVDGSSYNIVNKDGVFTSDMPNWIDSPIWWEKFNAIKHRVKHIYMLGGEPFIVKGHGALLDNLIESGHAGDIVLEYDTNLSVINPVILDKLAKFKNIRLSVSIDEIGEQYDLIRFGGKFETLVRNLEKLKERNIKITRISTCLGIHSMFAPINVWNYFHKLGYERYSFRFLRHPKHSDVHNLPDHLKEKLIAIYQNANLEPKWRDFYIGSMKNSMGKLSKEEAEQSVRDYITFMDKLDVIRGTNWKVTLSDVAEFLKEYL